MVSHRALIIACILLGLVLTSFSIAQDNENLEGMARVIDGDKLEVDGRLVRLLGIDALERTQWCINQDGIIHNCGEEALRALNQHIGGRDVKCEVKPERDRHGWAIGVCFVETSSPHGWEDLNAWLISNGHALSYRSYNERYLAEQQSAQEEKRGMWANQFVEPWQWRRGERPTPVAIAIPSQ